MKSKKVFNPAVTHTTITSEKENDIDRVNRGFRHGMDQYYGEDQKVGAAILTGAYTYGEKHHVLPFINPQELTLVRNLLYNIHHQKGFLTLAVQYAGDDIQKALTYRHMAKKAHTQKKFDVEKEYYAKAFDLFQQSHTLNAQARKHYEDALWCGRGYEYNPSVIRNYYLHQLENAAGLRSGYLDYLTTETYLLSNKIIKQAFIKLSKLANDDPATQCTLAQIYLKGKEGIRPCPTKSLEFCRDAVCSLASVEVGQSLHEYHHLLDSITQLSKYSATQQEALTLEKYFKVLTAIKTGDFIQLAHLAELYYSDTTIESLPLQLLCGHVNPAIARFIQDSTISDPMLINFWKCEQGKLAVHVLEWALLDLSLNPEIKDIFHTIIGGYHYYNNSFHGAIAHFKQCSNYEKNLYLQALSMQVNPDNCHTQLASILPQLEQVQLSSKNEKNKATKKIIGEICGYDSSEPIDHIISICGQYVPLLALSTRNDHPIEYGYVLLALNDLRKNTSQLSVNERKEALALTTYFNFFSALESDDQKKLDALFSTKNSELTGIRRTVLQAMRGNKKNEVQKIMFETEAFAKFCISDVSLIKIIANIAQCTHDRFKIKPTQYNYILGGFAYREKDCDYARSCFLQCDQNDLYVQAKRLEMTRYQEMLPVIKSCVPLVKHVIPNDKNRTAISIITNIINGLDTIPVEFLLESHKYQEAYELANSLMQLNLPGTHPTICNIFIKIEKSITNTAEKSYQTLLQTPARINTYNAIKKIADEKSHLDCFCNTLAFINHEHCCVLHLDESDNISFSRECLKYLLCSLQHNTPKDDLEQCSKRVLCGKLACKHGALENSALLLDYAIECGNASALYQKAILLTKEKPISPENLSIAIDLLEKHAVSTDGATRRALSYRTLGKYYYSVKELEYTKKAFDCLKAAAELGNYEGAHLLALMYITGIQNYQVPDRKEAFTLLEKTINLNQDDSYADARYIRSYGYYTQGNYEKAHEDLLHILSIDTHHECQKSFTHWLMGLTKLFLNKNADISEDILFHLFKAHKYATEDKVTNPNSRLLREFTLSQNEKTLNWVKQKLNDIIINKKTDINSLDFCGLMGEVLLEQSTIEPSTSPIRTYAIDCLVYAAQNGHVESCFSLLFTTQEELDCADKISYLIALHNSNTDIQPMINSALNEIYPTDVMSQATLITRFAEKNMVAFNTYTRELYDHKKPRVIQPISYQIFSYEQAQLLIEKCIHIEYLTKSCELFRKNPAKSTPQEHFLTIFLGSLFSYSLDQKQLIKGALYLETSLKFFPLIQAKHIKKNLGYIYYKLGWTQSKANNIPLAIGYLKKGAALGSTHCFSLLTELTSVDPIEKISDSSSNLEENLTTFKRLLQRQKENSDYKLLICHRTDNMANEQQEYEEALKIILKEKCFPNLIKYKNPRVYLGYCLAGYHETQYNQSIQQAIQGAILYGTIANDDNPNKKFKDISILGQLCVLITQVIEKNNTQQMSMLLGTIKKELIKNKIDIKAFERFYKTFYKINLTQNKYWKR